MKRSEKIEINNRFYIIRDGDHYNVYDRNQPARRQGGHKKVFDNGTEQECRDWVERNMERKG